MKCFKYIGLIFLVLSSFLGMGQTVTLTVDNSSIPENSSGTITATLNTASSTETIISFAPSGNANLDGDYSVSYTGKGDIVVVAGPTSNLSNGNGSGQFMHVASVAIDANYNLYVADFYNRRIQKWVQGASSGTTVASGLGYVADVVIDSDNNLYIADYSNHKIVKWAVGAGSGTTIAGGNGAGSGANQLNYPHGVALDASNNVYVTDRYNHRVQRFAAGSSSSTNGVTVAGGNGRGSSANQFDMDWNAVPGGGIHVDSNNNIYIADSDNNRIQKWSSGSTSGSTISNGVSKPSGVVGDHNGNIYIADYLNSRVRKYTLSSGATSTVFGGWGDNTNQLKRVGNVTLDAAGNLYVADWQNNQIKKKYIGPSIIIPAGQTSASLTITGVDNSIDASDKTITLTPVAINASLASSSALSISLTDNDDPPVVSYVTSSTRNGSYKQGDVVYVRVVFNKAVTVTGNPQLTLETGSSDAVVNYSSGSGSTSLYFYYTIGSGHASSDLDYVATSSLALNSGTIIETGGTSAATLTLPSPGAANSLGANKGLVIDTELPTVTGITSTTADGSYKSGDIIAITVAFSEVVNVTGTPQLNLETGSSDVAVNYSSGSGSNTLIFNYTIGSGETSGDLDYVATSSLSLNSGTIKDLALNVATLTLASPGAANSLGANKALVIDTSNPPAFTLGTVAPTGGNIIFNRWNPTNTGLTVTIPVANDVSFMGGSIQIRANVASGGYENLGAAYAILVGDLNANKTLIFTALEFEALSGGLADLENVLFTAIITDKSGNATTATQSTSSITFDETVPTITVIATTAFSWGENLNSTEDDTDATVTLTTTGVEDGQTVTITLNGAIYTALTSSNSAAVTITAAGLQGLTNDQTYSLTADVKDVATNEAVTVTSANFTVDKTLPTIALTATNGTSNVADGSSSNAILTLTFTSSEPTIDFVAEDVTVSGGILSNFTAVSSTVYTATFTPTGGAGAKTIDVALATFTDAAANNNTASDQFNWTYTVPETTITFDKLSIAEHEFLIVTTALSFVSVQEINIDLGLSGTAILDTDYLIENTGANSMVFSIGDTLKTFIIKGIEDRRLTEGTETIILTPSATNASLASSNASTINLLDNSITLIKTDDPFTGLSSGAVSWGDYDQDGDKDVAIMGQSSISGAVTAVYRNDAGTFVNTNQSFARLYEGDITWIDIDKDGYLDLVVSGFNQTAQTVLYRNNGGTSFTKDETINLPQLFSTQMAWGDLDLDGDIDFAMMGVNDAGILESYIGFKENNQFLLKKDQFPALIKGALEIADVDLDGDNDLLYSGEDLNGNINSNIVRNSLFSNSSILSLPSLSNSSIALLNTGSIDGLGILIQGKNVTTSFSALNNGNYDFSGITTALNSGDITAGDFDNNGGTDIVITGEDDNGVAITKLFWEGDGKFEEFEVTLEGLRESTAELVDYDMDGDLDLFLMGLTDTGAKTVLYQTEIANKKNTKPAAPSNLQITDQGFGNVKFTWDAPNDDYSSVLGYVVRLGTTKGGSELSSTESDLTTGVRLMSKAPSINTNQYETQLNPGTYYWSVQAVDNGLKGSAFAAEGSFDLTYAWKSVNQGGIIDYKVATVADPVLKMVDIDGDDDLDVLYGSQNSAGTQLLQFDGYRLVSNTESKYGFISSAGTLSDIQASDINGDGIQDIWMSLNNGEGARFDFSTDSSFLSAAGLSEYKLYNAKSKIVDLNNDGKKEIISLGLTNNTVGATLKLYVLELDVTTTTPTLKITDQSDKITTLTASSFDFGDYDGDQDIDFLISGFNPSDGLASLLYQNNTQPGGQLSIASTLNDFVAVRDGTTDFIDFDSDGDLDVIYTGTAAGGDVFEIYLNELNEGKTEWPKITTNLSGIRNSKIDLGDFNSDGYTDIIYSGTLTGEGEVTKLSEYDPATKQYVASAFDISDIIKATVEFGDIDGDGDLDFSIAGEDKNNAGQYIFRTYRNYRNESAIVEQNSAIGSPRDPAGAPMTVGKWSKNVRPTAPKAKATRATNSPAMTRIQSNGRSSDSDSLTVMEFSWDGATDDNTPSAGLTYSLRIGSKPGSQDILSSDASGTGLRMSASTGNSGHSLVWNIALPAGTYYWAVQAIDAAYIGSVFSEELSFTIAGEVTTGNTPIIVADTFSLAENSVNATVVGTIQASDADGDTLIYSILSGNTDQAFGLDSSTGQLTVANSSALDYETTPAFSLLIKVSDGALSDSATFTINLTDVDEEEEETLSLADVSEMIYPNPTDGIVNIKMAAFKEATIYNLSGQRIMRSTDNRIDVGALSEGVYIIKLENRSGDRFSTRLIKE